MAEIGDEMYERLRQILERQNGRAYSFDEVKEIGNELIDFFGLLLELKNKVEAHEVSDGDII